MGEVGTVKWFSNERGYGFITMDDPADTNEYFVHYTSVDMDGYKSLEIGQKVSFVLKQTDKGIQAVNVVPAA